MEPNAALETAKHVLLVFGVILAAGTLAGLAARRLQVPDVAVYLLAGILLGTRIPKGAKTTNWAAHTLTPQQITYAATDAWACRVLFLRFRELGWV